jgi:hypothetical protein
MTPVSNDHEHCDTHRHELIDRWFDAQSHSYHNFNCVNNSVSDIELYTYVQCAVCTVQ